MVKMDEQKGYYQFLMMLYKGYIFHKRHYMYTIAELVFSLLIMCLPVIILVSLGEQATRSKLKLSNGIQYPTRSPFLLEQFNNTHGLGILYTPDTNITRSLVNKSATLWLKKSIYPSGHDLSDFFVKPFDSEKELADFAINAMADGIVVIGNVFSNFPVVNSSLPSSMKFKIRYGDPHTFQSFQTKELYYFEIRPRNTSYYQTSPFVSWQAAVEETFITMASGKTNFKVYTKRFPFPPYPSTEDVSFVIHLLPLFITNGAIVYLCLLAKHVVEEKNNRTKELLNMIGMSDFVYWGSIFTNALFVAIIISAVCTCLYTTEITKGLRVLQQTDSTVLFLLLLLFMVSSLLLVLIISAFCPRPMYAILLIVILFDAVISILLVYIFPPRDFKTFFEFELANKLALCLIPVGALLAMFDIIIRFESMSEGAHWNSLTDLSVSPGFNLAMCMATMVLSCVIFCIIIWYVNHICPWRPGFHKPIYFLFTRSYWCHTHKCSPPGDYKEEIADLFEEVSPNVAPTIVANALTKVYKMGVHSKTAVNNLSLNVYPGQITVLLGRNGAGKTTALNLLTGLVQPSSGCAKVNGCNMELNRRTAGKNLGICPQENVVFDYLTVEEHLRFYAGVKGVKWTEVSDEITRVLKMVNLESQRGQFPRNLAGGLKRSLSLAIALVGDSKILLLDEFSSGMDPKARRAVWNLLLKLRQSKTILMTTHSMEEADILGDRIAILSHGKLRCCGSTLFLKRKFGTGYRLNIMKGSICRMDKVTRIVRSFVPQATCQYSKGALTYAFAGSTSGLQLGQMFQALEVTKDALGIASFSMTVTTMDDVFIKVSTDQFEDESVAKIMKESFPSKALIENTWLKASSGEEGKFWGSQVWCLIVKRFNYALRYWQVLISHYVLPFAVSCLFLISLMHHAWSYPEIPPELALNFKSIYSNAQAFYSQNSNADDWVRDYAKILAGYGVTTFEHENPIEYLLNLGKEDLNAYLKDILVGATFENSSGVSTITAWYNGEPLHLQPISLSLAHSTLLRQYMGDASGLIEVTNSPFPNLLKLFDSARDINELEVELLTHVFIPLMLGFVSSNYILVPLHEQFTGSKLLQLMTGLSSTTYWFGMFFWDMFTHLIASGIIMVPYHIFVNTILQQPQTIAGMLMFYILYGWSSIPICYFMSGQIRNPGSGFTFILLFNIATGIILTLIMSAIERISPNNTVVGTVLWFLYILPCFSATWGLGNLLKVSYHNALCDRVPDNIVNVVCSASKPHPLVVPCCKEICGPTNQCFKKTMPISWGKDLCGPTLLFLSLGGIVYFGILMLGEKGYLRRLRATVRTCLPRKKTYAVPTLVSPSEPDEDVLREEERIKDYGPLLQNQEALMVIDLTRFFSNVCAVDYLTFGIRHQECFGLLGISGAGKTTIFRMLTGDIVPTKGNAFILEYSLSHHLKKFQSFVGYCPQDDSLIDRLTGREMLQLFASLRGISKRRAFSAITNLFEKLDMAKYADKQTRLYSASTKRKLSLALALIGSPPLILLDEPTAGLDTLSKRKIWSILTEVKNARNCSLLISSHSMEECETLCTRLAIMVNGQFRCLGTIPRLKSQFGQGYSVFIKLKREYHNADVILNVKTHFLGIYNTARLQDYNEGMLLFHIPDSSIPWSQLFMSLEEIKQSMDLEDYLISGTTLEQIFLSFARGQHFKSFSY